MCRSDVDSRFHFLNAYFRSMLVYVLNVSFYFPYQPTHAVFRITTACVQSVKLDCNVARVRRKFTVCLCFVDRASWYVHSEINNLLHFSCIYSIASPTRCTRIFLNVFFITLHLLYMFRVLFAPIIRSTNFRVHP
jgi:hypothetical protein